MDVKLPDGTILRNVPEGTTKAQIQAKMGGAQGEASGAGMAALQGFNSAVPFGRKITSAIGAGIATAGGAGNYSDLYRQAEADAKATSDANPMANLAGTALGIGATLPVGLGNVGKQIGAAVGAKTFEGAGKLAQAGNLAAKAIKSGVVAAPLGALYGAGEAQSGQEAQGAKTGAVLAGAIGGALPLAGAALGAGVAGAKNLYKGASARSVDDLQKAGQFLSRKSSNTYKQFREAGAVLNPNTVKGIVSNIDNALSETGRLNSSLHGKTISVLGDLSEEAQSGNLSLESLDQYRQLLGDVIRSDTDVAGRMGADAFKAKTAIKTIDDAVSSLGDADVIGDKGAVGLLRQARQEWSQNRKFGDISRLVERSGGDANKLKRDLSSFLSNPKKTGSFSKEELKLLKEAANQTTGEGLLKMVGKFGFDIGSGRSVGNTALPIIGGLATGAGSSAGLGALVPVAGTAARQAQKWVARGKVETLLNLIEQGGKVSAKQIMELPPSDAKALMKVPQVKAVMAAKITPQKTAAVKNTVEAINPYSKNSSWVIVDKSNGKAVMETFDQSIIGKVNTDKYDVKPIYDYLSELNANIKKGK